MLIKAKKEDAASECRVEDQKKKNEIVHLNRVDSCSALHTTAAASLALSDFLS